MIISDTPSTTLDTSYHHSNTSSDTEFTNATSQSLHTTHTELSSLARPGLPPTTTDLELQKKYTIHQPDVAGEMEKWYAMTDR